MPGTMTFPGSVRIRQARSGAGPGNANGAPGTSARLPLEQLPGVTPGRREGNRSWTVNRFKGLPFL